MARDRNTLDILSVTIDDAYAWDVSDVAESLLLVLGSDGAGGRDFGDGLGVHTAIEHGPKRFMKAFETRCKKKRSSERKGSASRRSTEGGLGRRENAAILRIL